MTLNSLQELIYHKIQPTNQPINQTKSNQTKPMSAHLAIEYSISEEG